MKNFTIHIFCLFFFYCSKSETIILDQSELELKIENGILNYFDKRFSGKIVSFYSNKQKKLEINYLNGRKNGVKKKWYKSGEIASERNYLNNVKIGVHKGYWENGLKKFLYHFNSNGEYTGTLEEWYNSGNRYRFFNYINGKEVGNQKLWHETGDVKANYDVIDEERYGLIGLKNCYKVNNGQIIK